MQIIVWREEKAFLDRYKRSQALVNVGKSQRVRDKERKKGE